MSSQDVDLLAHAMTAVASVVGIGVGVFAALWAGVRAEMRMSMDSMARAMQREITRAEINDSTAKGTIARLRRQRDELLRAISDARSALIEVQAEARAREDQIRRQAMDSTFGGLR
jgi:hypothetical protein